ncbi:MAG: prepilin-type N-terminal cleavage/methylation domain-containing protein [Candidatus Sumerlaeia bacterium]|nr:prepilin-type N-terminal cleavage/methylation domain-containing protein [Candidatus Sumerlaeia bacterium]
MPNASRSRALTLIELLVAVAIVAILAALAVPHFLEYQTRSKVSVARNNQRVVAGGMESYRVDHNAYPAGVVLPTDPYGIFADSALTLLTTPVSYVGPAAFRDPFGQVQSHRQSLGTGVLNSPFELPYPVINPGHALLYFFYPSLAARTGLEMLRVDGFAVISIGPDRDDSFIVYHPFPEALPVAAAYYGITSAWDSVYDPTNGTISEGDLARFGGAVPGPAVVGGGPN